MSGRPWLGAAELDALVRAAATARANGVPWKVIEHLYGRSRWQLRRLVSANETNAPKNPGNAPSPRLRDHAAA